MFISEFDSAVTRDLVVACLARDPGLEFSTSLGCIAAVLAYHTHNPSGVHLLLLFLSLSLSLSLSLINFHGSYYSFSSSS